jgi:DNA-binding response OmpR family regulator
MSPQKLLLIDDDLELCTLLGEYLRNEGFEVQFAHRGDEGLTELQTGPYDAAVLDIMLPGKNGVEVLKSLRQRSEMPVIMLTAKGDDLDRILGLELGADDYLPKPCNPRELLARIKAILRRGQHNTENNERIIEASGLRIETGKHQIHYQSHTLTLTNAEYNILTLLIQAAGDVVTKETLYDKALGRKFTAYDRSVDMHVSNIRKKLAEFSDVELINNIRGVGYMLNAL